MKEIWQPTKPLKARPAGPLLNGLPPISHSSPFPRYIDLPIYPHHNPDKLSSITQFTATATDSNIPTTAPTQTEHHNAG
jgi:hypothetical protein